MALDYLKARSAIAVTFARRAFLFSHSFIFMPFPVRAGKVLFLFPSEEKTFPLFL